MPSSPTNNNVYQNATAHCPVTSTPRQSLHDVNFKFQQNGITRISLFSPRCSTEPHAVIEIPSASNGPAMNFTPSLDNVDTTESDSLKSPSEFHHSSHGAQKTGRRRKSMHRCRSVNLHKQQWGKRREQRNIAYSQSRKLSEPFRKSLHRQSHSKHLKDFFADAPLPAPFISTDPFDIPTQDMNSSFEHLLNTKTSTFDPNCLNAQNKVWISDEENAMLSGQSNNSTVMSQRCTGFYLNSNKIPQVVHYKSRPRSSQGDLNGNNFSVNTLLRIPFKCTPALYLLITSIVCIILAVVYKISL